MGLHGLPVTMQLLLCSAQHTLYNYIIIGHDYGNKDHIQIPYLFQCLHNSHITLPHAIHNNNTHTYARIVGVCVATI